MIGGVIGLVIIGVILLKEKAILRFGRKYKETITLTIMEMRYTILTVMLVA